MSPKGSRWAHYPSSFPCDSLSIACRTQPKLLETHGCYTGCLDLKGRSSQDRDVVGTPPSAAHQSTRLVCMLAFMLHRPHAGYAGQSQRLGNPCNLRPVRKFVFQGQAHVAHGSSNGDVLDSDKLGLHHGLSIFQKHCNNVVQVAVDLIQCFPLRMSAGEIGNKIGEQSCLRAPLNYR